MSEMEHRAKITGRAGAHAAFVANLLPALVPVTPWVLPTRAHAPRALPQPWALTRAEGGVADVRGEPADQPSRPEEQPGHSVGSQDAGAPTPDRGARNELRSRRQAALPPAPATGTERSVRERP